MSGRTFYMQQRYYDPVAGRFLSTDPVVSDANTGGSFGRYHYAANNPYKNIDPDGRNPLGFVVGVITEVTWQMAVEGKSPGQIDGTDVIISGFIGMILLGGGSSALRAMKSAPEITKALRAIKGLESKAINTPKQLSKTHAEVTKNMVTVTKEVADVGATIVKALAGVVGKNVLEEALEKQNEKETKDAPTTDGAAQGMSIRRDDELWNDRRERLHEPAPPVSF